MDWKTAGAVGFGLVIGWYVYYVNRYRKGDVQIGDITTLIGAIGGAAVLALFPGSSDLFGAYSIGLAVGFFLYFLTLIILVGKSDNFDSDWFLDGRRKNPTGDYGYGAEMQRPMAVMHAPGGGIPAGQVINIGTAPAAPAPAGAPHPGAMIASAAAAGGADPDDPARPAPGDMDENDTADFESARIRANLGAVTVEEEPPDAAAAAAPPAAAAAPATMAIDIARAQEFLHACMTSNPRVKYGLGAKVPFHGAVPGRDFKRVDCSGFVREAIWRATDPHVNFPDGSVVQHDWVKNKGFQRVTVADGGLSDSHVRIAFLRPQDTSSHIGHVLLLSNGRTLESHGGVGPDSRVWTDLSFRTKMFVYLLK
jgi:hypothetical protein